MASGLNQSILKVALLTGGAALLASVPLLFWLCIWADAMYAAWFIIPMLAIIHCISVATSVNSALTDARGYVLEGMFTLDELKKKVWKYLQYVHLGGYALMAAMTFLSGLSKELHFIVLALSLPALGGVLFGVMHTSHVLQWQIENQAFPDPQKTSARSVLDAPISLSHPGTENIVDATEEPTPAPRRRRRD